MTIDFFQNVLPVANSIAASGISYYNDILRREMKIATGETIASLSYEVRVAINSILITYTAGTGLFFIEAGKRANTKLPVRKVGQQWELLGNLPQWKIAVNFLGTDYQLAYSIAKNSRDPIPITDEVKRLMTEEIKKEITAYLKVALPGIVKQEVAAIFR